MRRLRLDLEPWRDTQAAREVDEQLAAVGSARGQSETTRDWRTLSVTSLEINYCLICPTRRLDSCRASVKAAAAPTGGTGSSAGAAWSPSATTGWPRGDWEAERAWPSWLGRLLAELTEEVEMRRITAGLFITVDGVVESPDQWQEGYFNEEMGEAVGAGMAGSDTMLLGRRTYEEFAGYWPHNPEADGADYMNSTPKLVVSTTLDTLAWQPATLIRGNLAEELTKLKQQPGKDVQVIGSPTLVGSLLREGLLDELALLVHPVMVGRGKRLFQDGDAKVPLRLADSKTFSTGVLSLTYRPAGG